MHADAKCLAHRRHEVRNEPLDDLLVPRAGRAHLDEHPVDELDAGVLVQDPGLDHRQHVLDGEAVRRSDG